MTLVNVSLLIALGATTLENVPAGTGPIISLNCAGTEPHLIDCSLYPRYYYEHCDHSQDVGVRCLTRGSGTGVYVCMCGSISDMLSRVLISWVITQLDIIVLVLHLLLP